LLLADILYQTNQLVIARENLFFVFGTCRWRFLSSVVHLAIRLNNEFRLS